MLEIVQLIKERDNIKTAYQYGMPVDFSKFRSICREFNRRCVSKNVFNTDGTDQQLWESVNTYFRMLLKKS